MLDGSKSRDAIGSKLALKWVITSAPSVFEPIESNQMYVILNVDQPGSISVKLSATNF
jgi:hypothetical protein